MNMMWDPPPDKIFNGFKGLVRKSIGGNNKFIIHDVGTGWYEIFSQQNKFKGPENKKVSSVELKIRQDLGRFICK